MLSPWWSRMTVWVSRVSSLFRSKLCTTRDWDDFPYWLCVRRNDNMLVLAYNEWQQQLMLARFENTSLYCTIATNWLYSSQFLLYCGTYVWCMTRFPHISHSGILPPPGISHWNLAKSVHSLWLGPISLAPHTFGSSRSTNCSLLLYASPHSNFLGLKLFKKAWGWESGRNL